MHMQVVLFLCLLGDLGANSLGANSPGGGQEGRRIGQIDAGGLPASGHPKGRY